MEKRVLVVGFGGQGILFTGKLLAYMGLLNNQNVTWMPSYGAEMRGGTSSCGITLSDEEIGSPVVDKPDCLIAMNLPSLLKFEPAVVPGGILLLDSSLVDRKPVREDIKVCLIPATKMAYDNDLEGLANLILLGKLLAMTGLVPRDLVEPALGKVVSARRMSLFEANLRALDLGYSYNLS